MDLVLVAEGGFDASVTLANQFWDMAAVVVIAREAGVAVTDLDGSSCSLDSRTTITAVPGVHDELLRLVRRGRRRQSL